MPLPVALYMCVCVKAGLSPQGKNTEGFVEQSTEPKGNDVEN